MHTLYSAAQQSCNFGMTVGKLCLAGATCRLQGTPAEEQAAALQQTTSAMPMQSDVMSDTSSDDASEGTSCIHDCLQAWLHAAMDKRTKLHLSMQRANGHAAAEEDFVLLDQLRGGESSIWSVKSCAEHSGVLGGDRSVLTLKVARVDFPEAAPDVCLQRDQLNGERLYQLLS